MTSSYTFTRSATNTFTEARVRHVMNKVLDDLVMVAACGFASTEKIVRWHEEVQAVLMLEAAELFQVKFARPDGKPAAITYKISDDGSLSEDGASGGLNYFVHPAGTTASIVIRLRTGAKKRQQAVDYLKQRGWNFNGSILEDEGVRDNAFSMRGYGVTRNLVGTWS